MYFITYWVLSVLLLQQTASSDIIEFCNPVSTHSVSVNQSTSDIGLFLVSPNYPENYHITEGCSVVLHFTVDQSFGVYITENVSSCDTPLLYQVATFNFNSTHIYSCTLSTAFTLTRVHQIIFQNSSNSDTVSIGLNEGAGNGFKLSVASTTPTRAHQVTINRSFITTTQWKFSDLMTNSRDVTRCLPLMGRSTIPDSNISSAPPIYINLPSSSPAAAAASIGRQVHRYSDIDIHTGQYENITDSSVLSNERNGATQEGEYTELQPYTDIDHTYAALG